MGCQPTTLPNDITQKLTLLEDEVDKISRAFNSVMKRAKNAFHTKQLRIQNYEEVAEWKDKCESKLFELEECVDLLRSKIHSQKSQEQLESLESEKIEELEELVIRKHKKLLKYIKHLQGLNE